MKKTNIIIRDLKHLKGKTYFGGACTVDRNDTDIDEYNQYLDIDNLRNKKDIKKALVNWLKENY